MTDAEQQDNPLLQSLARAADALSRPWRSPAGDWRADDAGAVLALLSGVAEGMEQLVRTWLVDTTGPEGPLNFFGAEGAMIRTADAFALAKREIDDLLHLRETVRDESKEQGS